MFFTACSIKCENLGDVLRTSKASRDIPPSSSPFRMRRDIMRTFDVTFATRPVPECEFRECYSAVQL